MHHQPIRASELALGDVITLDTYGDYCCATVERIDNDGTVHVLRPYVHTADFSYGGGDDRRIITYLGWENYSLRPGATAIIVRRARRSER